MTELEGPDVPRLVAQALAISRTLHEAGVGPCSLPDGVLELAHRAEQARAALQELVKAIDQERRTSGWQYLLHTERFKTALRQARRVVRGEKKR